MDSPEIKTFVAEQLAKGLSLTDIQKLLADEKGVKMTFLDLRILASSLENVDWSKQNKAEADKNKNLDSIESEKNGDTSDNSEAPGETDEFDDLEEDDPQEDDSEMEPAESDETSAASGKTEVELNKIARPGAVLSGSVRFGSGAKAEWVLDQLGRVGLEKAVGKPTKKDVQEFQVELQKLLSRHV